MSFLDTRSPLVLLHRDIESLPDISRYDIILSPQFYIVKNEDVPVKYPFQAKKLAPSILDDLSGDDANLTYEAFRSGDKWSFVGYDLDALAQFIDIKGGSINKVGRIYFAEQLKGHLDTPVELNDREVLGVVDDMVTIIPRQLLPEDVAVAPFDQHSMRPDSSFSVKKSFNSLIDTKQALIIGGLLLALSVAYFAEGYRYSHALAKSDERLEKLLDANPSLASAYTRQSIYKKYIKTDTTQRDIREKIKVIGRMTSKTSKIDSLDIGENGYKLMIDTKTDPKIVNKLQKIAKDGGLTPPKMAGNKLVVEGKIK